MRITMTAAATACAALFLLACDAGSPTASADPGQKPQLDQVNNRGCPPEWLVETGWPVGVDPDRNGDGTVCLRLKTTLGEPPIDNNIPVGVAGVGLVSPLVEAPLISVSVITANQCQFTFTIQPMALSPPDHKYVQLNLGDLIPGFSDSCDPSANLARNSRIVCIGSDEAEDAPGADGNTLIDMTINGATTMALRAERDPRLDGRVYTIGIQVTDAFNNVASTTTTVTVPVTNQTAAIWGPGPGYSIGASPSSCS